jgi:hypothetical protein
VYLDEVDASEDAHDKLDASWRAFDWVEWSTYTDDADDEDEEFEDDDGVGTESRDGRSRYEDG